MLQGYSGDHELQGKYTEISQPEHLQQAGHLQPQAAQSPGRRTEFPICVTKAPVVQPTTGALFNLNQSFSAKCIQSL